MTRFEDLSNDLLIEVFDYLDFDHIITRFYGLQRRINDCIHCYPASKVILTRALINRLIKGSFRCQSLIVSGLRIPDMRKLLQDVQIHVTEQLEISDVSMKLCSLLFRNSPVQHFKSLTVRDLIEEEWLTRNLPSFAMKEDMAAAPRYTFHFPSLQWASLKGVKARDLLIILQHSPNLNHLKMNLEKQFLDQDKPINFVHKELRILHLYNECSDALPMLHILFKMLPSLTDVVYRSWHPTVPYPSRHEAEVWQLLTQRYLTELSTLHLKFYRHTSYLDTNEQVDTSIKESFANSLFWSSRNIEYCVQVIDA